jgi:hypothetical protein
LIWEQTIVVGDRDDEVRPVRMAASRDERERGGDERLRGE